METPTELLYTTEHEWAKFEGAIVIIGITDFAQSELGDIIFIEFPNIGQEFLLGDPYGTIEAVKTVADINAPISGKIIAINESLDDTPELVNNDPYGAGWLIKIQASDPSEKEQLISATDYQNLIG